MYIPEYPKEIPAIQSEDKTLSINCFLSTPEYDKENNNRKIPSPYAMHAGYSRFVLTLISFKNGKKYTIANIPAQDIKYISKKTDIALQATTMAARKKKTNTNLSSAYKQKLYMGTYKNYTPAEVLIEDPNNLKELLKTKIMLEENLAKYKKNQLQIDAINEAINLLEKGILHNTDIEDKENDIVIYNENFKSLESRQDEYGNYLIYHVQILCRPSDNNPFIVLIKNYYAKVEKTDDGANKVQASNAINIQEITMQIPEKDWVNTINRMVDTVNLFEMLNAKNQFQLAEKFHKIKENEYKSKKNSYGNQ